MISNQNVFNALEAIKNIVTIDLLPLFDSLKVTYAPSPTTVLLDWLTYINSANFDPSVFVSESQSFIDYVSNANNFLALNADSFAYNIIMTTSSARDIFIASPCFSLFPFREVSLSAFNSEPMTGNVIIVSYRAYPTSSTSESFWELQIRSSGFPLCRVLNLYRDSFISLRKFIPKAPLGNYYSFNSGYSFEADCTLRVIDV